MEENVAEPYLSKLVDLEETTMDRRNCTGPSLSSVVAVLPWQAPVGLVRQGRATDNGALTARMWWGSPGSEECKAGRASASPLQSLPQGRSPPRLSGLSVANSTTEEKALVTSPEKPSVACWWVMRTTSA